MKKYGAEFFGTFWLVLGGCGSAVLAAAFPNLGIGFLGVALAFAIDRVAALFRHRGVATVVVLALAVGCLWDYGRRIDPTICRYGMSSPASTDPTHGETPGRICAAVSRTNRTL